jgi:hypothetical protein
MPGGDARRKKWNHMTTREIVSALSAYTLIGGAIIGAAVYRIAQANVLNAWIVLWPAPLILFAAAFVGLAYFQALRELRRRRTSIRLTSRCS